jgi:hypothetical protein
VTRIDHVIFAVRDPAAAASRLSAEFGLAAQPGGSHGHGVTHNLYVPLGRDQYIELLAISDPESSHPMVAALRRALSDGDRLFNVALTSERIETDAERLHEPIFDVQTSSPDGRNIAFRLTGVSGLIGPQPLPFFVQTISGHQWRGGFEPSRHRIEPDGISRIEYGGNPTTVFERINDPSLPVQVVAGRPGLNAIWIRQASGEVELRF